MRESSTYQAILQEGREEGRHEGAVGAIRRAVLELGSERFGPADPITASQIKQLEDVDRLNQLLHGLLRVSNWQELRELADQG